MTPESVLDPMYKDGNFFEGDLAIRKELIESYYESDDASVSFTTIICCFEAFIHRSPSVSNPCILQHRMLFNNRVENQ